MTLCPTSCLDPIPDPVAWYVLSIQSQAALGLLGLGILMFLAACFVGRLARNGY